MAADSEIVKELEQEAKKKGYTMYAITNLALKSLVKLLKSGEDATTLEKLVNLYLLTKSIDTLPVPLWFLESVIKLLYEKDKKAYTEFCEAAGTQLAIFLKSRAHDIYELIKLYSDVKGVFPLKEFYISEENGGNLNIRITGTGFSQESTECAYYALKKILASYDIQVIKESISPSIISLTAKYYGQLSNILHADNTLHTT
ncbi:MAG: hypothetical protein OWQ54_08460 [Sulfolobaceae archaeon]|nr:hypothetical protein [Sulfolobaceae archaeon]